MSNGDERAPRGRGAKRALAVLIFLLAFIGGGVFFFNLGKSSSSTRQLSSIDEVVGQTRNPEELLKLAEELLNQGRYEDALKILSEIDGTSDDVSADVQRLLRAALDKSRDEGRQEGFLTALQNLLDSGRALDAERIFNALFPSENDIPDSLKEQALSLRDRIVAGAQVERKAQDAAEQARRLIDEGRYDEALALIETIESQNPALRDEIANLKATSENAKRADEDAADAIATARRLMGEGRYDEALKVLGSTEANDPTLNVEIARLKEEAELTSGATALDNSGTDSAQSADVAASDAIEEARRLMSEGRYDEAMNALNSEQGGGASDPALQSEIAQLKSEAERSSKAQIETAAQETARKAEEDSRRRAAELAQKKAEVNNSIEQGKRLLDEKKYDDAISEFHNAKDSMPSDDRAFAAEKYGDASISLYNASNAAEDTANKEKLSDEAGSFAKDSLSNDPGSAPALFVKAMADMERGSLSDAEAALRKAVEQDGNNSTYSYQLGRVLAMQGKYPEALSAFKTSIDQDDSFAPAHYNAGYSYEHVGEPDNAQKEYERAIRLDANLWRAYMALGRLCFEKGDYNGALTHYNEARDADGTHAEIYQETGICCSALGDYAAAKDNFLKALSCADSSPSNNAVTYYNLSSVMYETGDMAGALSYAEKAYNDKDKTSIQSNITYNYGLLLEENGDSASAMEKYQETLSYDPNHVKACTNLAKLLLAQDEPELARDLLLRAYTAESDNFEVNNNLGSAYRDLEDYENSEKYYKNALALQSDNREVKENLAKAYVSGKDFESAKPLYEDLIKEQQTNWSLFLDLAKVCMFAGDIDSCEKYLVYLQANAPDYKADEVELLLLEIQN